MSKFINPFTDYGFKLLFGQEISKELLADFLNDLLEGEYVIHDLTFLPNEQLPDYPEGRGMIYDIYCTTSTGEHIIVEMQGGTQANFKERSLFYMSRAINAQGRVGSEWAFDLKAVYGVFLMNFVLAENRKLRTDVVLADRETGQLFNEKFRQVFISLPLFNKTEEECATDFERWLYVLKNMETLKRMPFKARKAVFEKLEEIADIAALPPKERHRYEQSMKVYRDYLVTMMGAKQEGRREGLQEGREEGRQEGREEGRQEGRQEGKQQGKEEGKREVAANLKKLGIAHATIAQTTGLSIEEIERLE